jgi:hypothetical protein
VGKMLSVLAIIGEICRGLFSDESHQEQLS